MEKTDFWNLIALIRTHSVGDCEEFCGILRAVLLELTQEQIIAFDRYVTEYRFRAYKADLWGAADIMKGGCSDDGFEYFRCWLISQGEAIYMNALEDPESLAAVDQREADSSDEFECEQLMYTPDKAYEEMVGRKIPESMMDIGDYPELVGQLLSEEEYDAMYPKLVARFGA